MYTLVLLLFAALLFLLVFFYFFKRLKKESFQTSSDPLGTVLQPFESKLISWKGTVVFPGSSTVYSSEYSMNAFPNRDAFSQIQADYWNARTGNASPNTPITTFVGQSGQFAAEYTEYVLSLSYGALPSPPSSYTVKLRFTYTDVHNTVQVTGYIPVRITPSPNLTQNILLNGVVTEFIEDYDLLYFELVSSNGGVIAPLSLTKAYIVKTNYTGADSSSAVLSQIVYKSLGTFPVTITEPSSTLSQILTNVSNAFRFRLAPTGTSVGIGTIVTTSNISKNLRFSFYVASTTASSGKTATFYVCTQTDQGTNYTQWSNPGFFNIPTTPNRYVTRDISLICPGGNSTSFYLCVVLPNNTGTMVIRNASILDVTGSYFSVVVSGNSGNAGGITLTSGAPTFCSAYSPLPGYYGDLFNLATSAYTNKNTMDTFYLVSSPLITTSLSANLDPSVKIGAGFSLVGMLFTNASSTSSTILTVNLGGDSKATIDLLGVSFTFQGTTLRLPFQVGLTPPCFLSYKMEIVPQNSGSGYSVVLAATPGKGIESVSTAALQSINTNGSLNPTLIPDVSTMLYTTMLYVNTTSSADYMRLLSPSQNKVSYYVEAFQDSYRYSSTGSIVAINVENPTFLYNFSYQQKLSWSTVPANNNTATQTLSIAQFLDGSGTPVLSLELQLPQATVPYAQLVVRLASASTSPTVILGSNYILYGNNGNKRTANIQLIGYNNQISCSVLESPSESPIIISGLFSNNIASVKFTGMGGSFDLASSGAILYNTALSSGSLAANLSNLLAGSALQKIVPPFGVTA